MLFQSFIILTVFSQCIFHGVIGILGAGVIFPGTFKIKRKSDNWGQGTRSVLPIIANYLLIGLANRKIMAMFT